MQKLLFKIVPYILVFIIGFLVATKVTYKTPISNTTISNDTLSTHIGYIPKPYNVDTPTIVYIKTHDTIKVPDTVILTVKDTISDWLLTRKYKLDSTFNDVKLNINWDVNKNRTTNFNLTLNNNRLTTINKSVIKPKPKFYLGGGIGGNNLKFDVFLYGAYQNNNILYFTQYHTFSKTAFAGMAMGF